MNVLRPLFCALTLGQTGSVSDEVAVSDFLLYVSYVEICLLVKAGNDFSNLRKTDMDDLISIYSMYGLLELPKANLIEDQKNTLARVEMVCLLDVILIWFNGTSARLFVGNDGVLGLFCAHCLG